MSPHCIKYKQKLFRIATRPHKIHRNPEIVLPSPSGKILAEQLFRPGKRRRVLELGSGWGEFLSQWLSSFAEDDYTAFEIKKDRIDKTLKRVRKLNTGLPLHLRIIPINFNWFLEDILPPHSFDMAMINFPDPWPKHRHWKHRLVQEGFDERLAKILREQALLYLSTDYGPYARKMLSLFRRSPHFRSVYPWPHYLREHPTDLPLSRFEQMHQKAGRSCYYFCWQFKLVSRG